jgi:alpha-D-ribose 1-methylphosphonate 5-triphosphate synthase subunit PhnG
MQPPEPDFMSAPRSNPSPGPDAPRRAAMAVLSRASIDRLEAAWASLDPKPEVTDVRAPEVGLVMVRGRTGGGGRAFNLGEATVARATVRLASGTVGFGHVLGRDRRRAWLAAVFDALWQEDPDRVSALVIEPAWAEEEARDRLAAEEAAATRVDFFTLVRGDSE